MLLVCAPLAHAALPAPELETGLDNGEAAKAGVYALSWTWQGQGDAPVEFELQEATSRDFTTARTIYRGPDRGSTLTGRSDGTYFYRIRALTSDNRSGPWSAPEVVEVNHHSLARALRFFTVGAVVFLATLGLIVAGGLRDRRARHG